MPFNEPKKTALSMIGALVCGVCLLGGLFLTAFVVSQPKNPLVQAGLFVAGIMGTFGAVWLAGEVDYAVRMAIYRVLNGQNLSDTSKVKNPRQTGTETEFFKMLFFGLITVTAAILMASFVYKCAGSTVFTIIFGPGLLLLGLFTRRKRL